MKSLHFLVKKVPGSFLCHFLFPTVSHKVSLTYRNSEYFPQSFYRMWFLMRVILFSLWKYFRHSFHIIFVNKFMQCNMMQNIFSLFYSCMVTFTIRITWIILCIAPMPFLIVLYCRIFCELLFYMSTSLRLGFYTVFGSSLG